MNRELLQNIIDQQADQIDLMSSLLLLTTVAVAVLLLWVIFLRGIPHRKPHTKPSRKRDILIIIGPDNSGKTVLRKQLCGNRPTMVIPSNELCHERKFIGLHEDFLTGFDIVIDATYKNEPAVLVRHILMDHVTFHKYGESEPRSIPVKRVLVPNGQMDP